MFSYFFYNVVHVVGIVLLMAGLGGMAILGATSDRPRGLRRLVAVFHGLGAYVILLGGFGMLARLGLVAGWPGWVWAKVLIWGVLAIAAFLPYRVPRLAVPLLVALPVLGGLAAYMAIYKPL